MAATTAEHAKPTRSLRSRPPARGSKPPGKERAELGVQQREWATGIAEVETQLRGLAQTDPGQFGPDGLPKPKSEAASLRSALEKAKASNWPDVIAGGDERLRQAETAYRGAVRDNAITLARIQYERSREGVRRVQELGEELRGALGEVVEA